MGGPLDPTVARARTLVTAALADLEPGNDVVLAVSGGADSLALAATAAFVTRRDALAARVVVVDHGLQEGSDRVAAEAARRTSALGLPSEVVRVQVTGPGGPEAAARSARYAALESTGAPAVLLAHTLDDQAETVLLGLGRGSGGRSLAGMTAADGRWRRPFLALRRADTEQVCRVSGLQWWRDPHNDDPRFRRVRLRHEVVPLLEQVLGGGVAEALARTASQLRADVDLLDELADAVERPTDVDVLAALPPALRSRVLRRVALGAGAEPGSLTAHHVLELERLVLAWHGQQRVELPGGISVRRVGPSLTWARTPVGG